MRSSNIYSQISGGELIKLNLEGKNIVVTGGNGFLGKWVIKTLTEEFGVKNSQITIPRSANCDLKELGNAKNLLKDKDVVINLAANVGGIGYNQKYPGTLFYDNMMIGINIMEAARFNDIEKLVQVGTVCSYPKFTKVPFMESALWDGFPEETNAPYGIAKKSLLVMGDAYFRQYGLKTVNPIVVNLYGPGDNFSTESSHVIPALIFKIHKAKIESNSRVDIWGSGSASREFIYVQDAARGIILTTTKYDSLDPVNIGSGEEITIRNLVDLIAKKLDYDGQVNWDKTKPDGQPKRRLDIKKALTEFGFKAAVELDKGLDHTIEWYYKNVYSTF